MTQAVKKQILACEEQLIHARRTLDIDALQRIYTDDLMMTGVLGETTCSKPSIMDEANRGIAERNSAVASGTSFQSSCENEDMQVSAFADTAVASYRFVVKVTGGNVNIDRRYRTTNVWVRRQDRWQIVAAHTSLILEAKQLPLLGG
jgi:ketosteroid isomerase-like protein